MLSQFAHVKVQSGTGEQTYVHYLPALIGSKRAETCTSAVLHEQLEVLPLTNIIDTNPYHALILHHHNHYRVIAASPLLLNSTEIYPDPKLVEALKTEPSLAQAIHSFLSAPSLDLKKTTPLPSIARLTVQSPSQSEVFYLCLPSANQQRVQSSNPKPSNPLPSKQNAVSSQAGGTKWSADDHEQLKKLLLQYGYGRWKQIQRSSTTIGGKLQNKSLPEIKAYSNSFLRALGLSLPEDETSLKLFLQKLIEENQAEYQEYQPCLKDWQQHIMLPHRSVQYTKRLQLLFRVKNLIHKYREDALKNMQVPDRRKISWDGLLNFIPLGLLFGQRPAVWWAKKNDIDLLLGVYKYGYANYVSIRNAKQYCFAELEKAQTYQDFPVADNLTRRLKKLINTIVKIQQNQGQIDFQDEAQSEEDEKSWNDAEKRLLFSIVVEYGVAIGQDGKSNWSQVKDKIKATIKDFNKTPSQVEKMVSRLRWNCQEIVSDEKMKEEPQGTGSFKITYEMATRFTKNINLLEFIRRSILLMEEENLKVFLKQAQIKSQELAEDHPAFIDTKNFSDQQLLTHINKVGISSIPSLKLNEAKVVARVEWLCEVYKLIKEKVQDKRKKYKIFDESTKKKAKFELNRDKDGNIKFPININPSLILVATGTINTNPNYHSEHNLFPVGYTSIRTHASMFTRGVRARYTCQILEGDGRPLYKVIPEEDPDHPIIKDSSTGCWVYVCNRVNQLQEVKKEKVTISGTERFGLLEHNVVRLLQDLPQAEKCLKYKFKRNLPKDQAE